MTWIRISLTKSEKDKFKELAKQKKLSMSKVVRILISNIKDFKKVELSEDNLGTAAFEISEKDNLKIEKLGEVFGLSRNSILRTLIINAIKEVVVKEDTQNENLKKVQLGFLFNENEFEKLNRKIKKSKFNLSELFRTQYKSFQLKDYKSESPKNRKVHIYMTRVEIKEFDKIASNNGFSRSGLAQALATQILNEDINVS